MFQKLLLLFVATLPMVIEVLHSGL